MNLDKFAYTITQLPDMQISAENYSRHCSHIVIKSSYHNLLHLRIQQGAYYGLLANPPGHIRLQVNICTNKVVASQTGVTRSASTLVHQFERMQQHLHFSQMCSRQKVGDQNLEGIQRECANGMAHFVQLKTLWVYPGTVLVAFFALLSLSLSLSLFIILCILYYLFISLLLLIKIRHQFVPILF